jgi:hypothetical protein
MKSVRAKFEEIWPVPEGVYWDSEYGEYLPNCGDAVDTSKEWDARLDTFTRCQEMMAIPEITKEQVFFALCCQMEDPSDDEEDGFNAGVSWCIAFIKQEIAKRNRK